MVFAGDGRRSSKGRQSVLFGFTILNEQRAALAAGHWYPLAVVAGGEDYENLRGGLADVIPDLSSVQARGLDVAQADHRTVRFMLCADLKFLHSTCGPGPCGGEYGCLFCTITKAERCALKVMPIDPKRFSYPLGKTVKASMGLKHHPLLPFISPHDVCVDLLHMFLRIMDVLIRELLKDVFYHHKAAGRPVAERVIRACGAPSFRFFTSKRAGASANRVGELCFTGLDGPQKRELLAGLDHRLLLPAARATWTAARWSEFGDLWTLLNTHPITIPPPEFQARADRWLRALTDASMGNQFGRKGGGYPRTIITPYMHIFHSHVHALFPYLKFLCCQSIERQNAHDAAFFFRSCYRGRAEFLPLFRHVLRLIFIEPLLPTGEKPCPRCHQPFRLLSLHKCRS
jgi:hypothetical protein